MRSLSFSNIAIIIQIAISNATHARQIEINNFMIFGSRCEIYDKAFCQNPTSSHLYMLYANLGVFALGVRHISNRICPQKNVRFFVCIVDLQ